MRNLILFFLLVFSIDAAAQKQHVYNSNFLSRPDTTWVFVPKGMEQKTQLPMIFLLHGYSGNYKQWDNIMNAQQYADKYGFIIVCPDGLFNSWYVDVPGKQNAQFQRFFFEELWPDIMQRYKPDASKVFISGLSMGGHGAFTLFLKHPEKFKSAGSTSGVLDLRVVVDKYGLPDLVSNRDKNDPLWLEMSARGNLEALKGTEKAIIFDCGADDVFYESNNDFKKLCDELKIKATYISQPGAHNRAYWAKSIKQHFDFFKALLP